MNQPPDHCPAAVCWNCWGSSDIQEADCGCGEVASTGETAMIIKANNCIGVALAALLAVGAAGAATVNESARNIPVAYDVDVVVVGGSTGAVAAAAQAAQSGAKVFLAAPRTYLGEDMCGTYRLWLNPGDKLTAPLAKALYAQAPALPVARGVRFTYQADKPSAGVHKDTRTPSRLTDGLYGNSAKQSVQYDGSVTITADLGRQVPVKKVRVLVFQRDKDFEVESVTVSAGSDKQQWKQVAKITNAKLGKGGFEDSPIDLSAPVTANARYLRFAVAKSQRVSRILLGEIIVETDKSAGAAMPPAPARPIRPVHVKRILDKALLDAGVTFLFGCYATDVLRDSEGNPAGIVMANRSGRQAVTAKVVIDATDRATVARLAGATFRAFPAGLQEFKRVVVGGTVRTGQGIRARKMPMPVRLTSRTRSRRAGRDYQAVEYTLKLAMPDGSFASLARAEQAARDETWHPGQVDASEVLFQVPPDPMKGTKGLGGAWPGAEKVTLDAFRPAGVKRLYVLGGCADMSREAARSLLRPPALISAGARIGQTAAKEAKALPRPKDVKLPGRKAQPAAKGDVRESLVGLGASRGSRRTIPSGDRAIPVLGSYDVVVVGGGTSGAPAGIGAARRGAKTLVIEYLHGLGGVGTLGLIGKYYYGHRAGFTREVDRGVAAIGGGKPRAGWNIEHKMEWYRRELRKAGADVWFGALGCGAFVEDGRVKGVVVATSGGRGVVLAKIVIDSTGNADIAAPAGAACTYTDGSHVAVQGTGLPPREPGASYTNTDYTFVDDADMIDVSSAFIAARTKYKNAYDVGQLIDTRERRRIVGDYVMSPLDIVNRRTYGDTVVLSKSNFDTHGFTVHPLFLLADPGRAGMSPYTPYRCLLPRGLDGIIVTGLGISAHRDAMPVLRMQPCVQNQGYAAGVAAAMAAKAGKGTRRIDVKALQKHLVEKGNLPKSVLTDKDSYPMSTAKIADAVESLVKGDKGLPVVLAQPKDAMPLLREAHKSAKTQKDKLAHARVLGMLGDAAGVGTLTAAIRAQAWDKGWNFRGMGQFGRSLSLLDSLIIALGRTRDKRAVEPILEKLGGLDAKKAFSHHRAVAMALETLADPAAAKPLADLLSKPEMTGHARATVRKAIESPRARNSSLRELVVARALYRCGDHEGLGEKILRAYAQDLRGHFSRHARAVLAETKRATGNQ